MMFRRTSRSRHGAASGITLRSPASWRRTRFELRLPTSPVMRPSPPLRPSSRMRGGPGVAADVTSRSAVQGLFGKVEAELGAVDILVNNAGMSIDRGGAGPR